MFVLLSLFVTAAIPRVAPPVCNAAHFLAKVYPDLLGRPLDSAGSAYWLGMMKNGMSRTQVASQLMNNPNYRIAKVRDLFNTLLHRAPSAGDLSYFAAMLQQGSNSEQVESAILGSAEYFTERGGGTNPGFLNAMFQDALGRPADSRAIAMFSQQMGGGISRAAIAQQVVNSTESRQRRINALYSRFLHHAASGHVLPGSEDAVAAAIVGSDEYCRQ